MTQKPKRWPETLGETACEIATTLLLQGVRGKPGCRRNCIIVRSYKHTYPNGWNGIKANYYKSSTDPSTFSGQITFEDDQITDPICPPQVAEFMYRFDCGEYPELLIKEIPNPQDVWAKVKSKLSQEELTAIGK